MAKIQVLNDDGTVETELDCAGGHIALGVDAGGDAAWNLSLHPRDQRNFVADLAPDGAEPAAHRDRRALAVGAAALLIRLAEDDPAAVQRALRHVLPAAGFHCGHKGPDQHCLVAQRPHLPGRLHSGRGRRRVDAG